MSRTTLHLATYTSGSIEWNMAARRLARSATRSGMFREVNVVSPKSLGRLAPNSTQHASLLQGDTRGAGYWLWKPLMIRALISQLSRGEALLYLDAGCDLNLKPDAARDRLASYQMDSLRDGWCLFDTPHSVLEWTKRDLLNHSGISRTLAGEATQVEAGVALFSAESIGLVDEWISLATIDGYHLLDDSPSVLPEYDEFLEHRHDQAILSVLLLKRGYVAPPREHWFHPDWHARGRDFPIWACRNSGPYPVPAPFGNTYARINWKVRSVRR